MPHPMLDVQALSALTKTKRSPKRLYGTFISVVLSGILATSTIVTYVFRSSDVSDIVLDRNGPHNLDLMPHARKDDSTSPLPGTETDYSSTVEVVDPTVVYWRFDEAAPRIRYAKTYFLRSIPAAHRLTPPTNTPTSSTSQPWNATKYFSQSENAWPNKLHLFEMNPSIIALPAKYKQALTIRNDVPVYLASFRVTHYNNCFDEETNLRMFGGSWRNLIDIKTDYLGLALLHEDLSVLADGVVSFGNVSAFETIFPKYNDYRIFNLHGELYLSTVNRIVPIYLSIFDTINISITANEQYASNEQVPPNFIQVPPAFSDVSLPKGPILHLWVRDFASCPVYGTGTTVPASFVNGHPKVKARQKRGKVSSKNLLYFVDGQNRTMVEHYPRRNPNDVRKVELNVECGRQEITEYAFDEDRNLVDTPPASFQNIDEFHFPISKRKSDIFMGDRGSSCCVSLNSPTTGQVVFVGVAHPKTLFPGRNLPEGVSPNIYMSRFFAFEKEAPYPIVARSGMFCLGYPDAEEQNVDRHANSPLVAVKLGQLHFANESYNCPRIHFVTGMVDKVGDDSKVILSYGVSDCLSRVVEIDKSEIASLLWSPKRLTTT